MCSMSLALQRLRGRSFVGKAGIPTVKKFRVTGKLDSFSFPPQTGHITLRVTGVNTVWVSWGDVPFDIAVGTSYECDQDTKRITFQTQTGVSELVANYIIWS